MIRNYMNGKTILQSIRFWKPGVSQWLYLFLMIRTSVKVILLRTFYLTRILLSLTRVNAGVFKYRWILILSGLQTKKDLCWYHVPVKSKKKNKRGKSDLDMINPTSITTVKCNSFTLKVASLSDVNYWGVSYLCISLEYIYEFKNRRVMHEISCLKHKFSF